MKERCLLTALCLLSLSLLSPRVSCGSESSKGTKDIYDESLDGRTQIDQAMLAASKEHKRILIQFGANWCGWCHKLHKLLESDKAVHEQLTANYVLVLVDVNKGHNHALVTKYEAEKLGLPSLVVLDADGKHLTTKNTAELEEGDHHSPDKVLSFLQKWSPHRSRLFPKDKQRG